MKLIKMIKKQNINDQKGAVLLKKSKFCGILMNVSFIDSLNIFYLSQIKHFSRFFLEIIQNLCSFSNNMSLQFNYYTKTYSANCKALSIKTKDVTFLTSLETNNYNIL